MELRNGALVGGSSGVMPKGMRPAFEAGLVRVFERWTALGLAVENCFGGGDSQRKADLLIDDVLQWFYSNKEHYADELAEELESGMLEDFNTILQDDSARQVARELVQLHAELLTGAQTSLHRLLQAPLPASAPGYRAPQEAGEEEGSSSSSEEEGEGPGDRGDRGEPSDGAEDMETDDAPALAPTAQPRTPVIDDDGFQLVQGRRRSGRRP